jgi:hypothetical protein
MAFFRNFGVNHRNSLCGVLSYASAQSLDFLELAQKFSFLGWKLACVQNSFLDGHQLGKEEVMETNFSRRGRAKEKKGGFSIILMS